MGNDSLAPVLQAGQAVFDGILEHKAPPDLRDNVEELIRRLDVAALPTRLAPTGSAIFTVALELMRGGSVRSPNRERFCKLFVEFEAVCEYLDEKGEQLQPPSESERDRHENVETKNPIRRRKAVCRLLPGRRLKMGDEQGQLSESEFAVLNLLASRGSADFKTLQKSGVEAPHKALKRIKKRYSWASDLIKMAGTPGGRGYSTSIKPMAAPKGANS